MKGGVDRGYCRDYERLSYRRKFICHARAAAILWLPFVILQMAGAVEWQLKRFHVPYSESIGWLWTGLFAINIFPRIAYNWHHWRQEVRSRPVPQQIQRGHKKSAATIIARSELVFSHAYDRGEPGEAGRDHVHQLNGWFAARTLDDGDLGPFATLEDALASADLGFVSQFTIKITTPKMGVWQAAALLHGESSSDGRRFLLNDEEWEYRTIGGPRPAGLVEVT